MGMFIYMPDAIDHSRTWYALNHFKAHFLGEINKQVKTKRYNYIQLTGLRSLSILILLTGNFYNMGQEKVRYLIFGLNVQIDRAQSRNRKFTVRKNLKHPIPYGGGWQCRLFWPILGIEAIIWFAPVDFFLVQILVKVT